MTALSIPYTVHNDAAFADLTRDDYPELKASVDNEARLVQKWLTRLWTPKVQNKRQIGFMAKHSIRGETWKAWI